MPEGSSVAEDGSIIAADGSILAPAGTVIIGEDGTLMMSENSALLSDTNTAAEAAAGGGAAGTVFTTPDGNSFKVGEGDILTNAEEGNFLMDEDGTILTMVHLGALGATTSPGVSLTSTAPTPASRCEHQIFLVANNKYFLLSQLLQHPLAQQSALLRPLARAPTSGPGDPVPRLLAPRHRAQDAAPAARGQPGGYIYHNIFKATLQLFFSGHDVLGQQPGGCRGGAVHRKY